jgi:XTP/dITP diphosphohydrolase
MLRIVLATHNRDKRKELLAVLQQELGDGIDLLTLDDIQPPIGDIDETGTTLEENALIKARTVFEQTGLATVADDTGLKVDALNGAPGVYSARYSGEGATYESNCAKLLREMRGKSDRRATFASVIAYIDASGTERLFRGEVEGAIIEKPRGTNGFGYDPVFEPSGTGKTFAEMTEAEKNAVSHRGRALRKFTDFLKNNLTLK